MTDEQKDILFLCGGCVSQFETISELHEHLQSHQEGGSYFYSHHTRTAYPKFDSLCKETQTADHLKSTQSVEPLNEVLVSSGRSDIRENEETERSGIVQCIHNDVVGLKDEDLDVQDVNKRRALVTKADETNAAAQMIYRYEQDYQTVGASPDIRESNEKTGKIGVVQCIHNDIFSLNNKDLDVQDVNKTRALVTKADETNAAAQMIYSYEQYYQTVGASPDIRESIEETERTGVDQCIHNDIASLKDEDQDVQHVNKRRTLGTKADETNAATQMIYSYEQDHKTVDISLDLEVDSDDSHENSSDDDLHSFDEEAGNKPKRPEDDSDYEPSSEEDAGAIETSDEYELPDHLKRHSQEPMTCQICQETLANQRSLRRHVRNVHKELQHVCMFCSEQLSTEDEYFKHWKQLHRDRFHQCRLCKKVLSNKLSLKSHRLLHKDTQKVTCSECNEQVADARQLKKHMRSHQDMKSLQCESCEKWFKTKSSLNSHLERCIRQRAKVKSNYKKFIVCDICGVSVCSKDLKKHKRVHSTEKPYICEVCGFSTVYKQNLIEHRRIHTKEMPYSCKQCPMTFSAPTRLYRHLYTHGKMKPHECSYCSKRFASAWNLKTHLRQHTGETPYTCKICGVGFKQNVLLKRHIKAHPEDVKA